MFPSFFKDIDVNSLHCDAFKFVKHHQVPFPLSNNRSLVPFLLINYDIWGPSRIHNVLRATWFVTFINDCTRMASVFLLKQKSNKSSVLLIFCSMIKNQFGVSVKNIRLNNVRDYFNQFLSPFLQRECIIHQSSCVDTPQHVAKRKNRHLLQVTRPLLFQNHVPKSYWGETVLTATHLINRLPPWVLGFKSHIKVFYEYIPNFTVLPKLPPKIFGCVICLYS